MTFRAVVPVLQHPTAAAALSAAALIPPGAVARTLAREWLGQTETASVAVVSPCEASAVQKAKTADATAWVSAEGAPAHWLCLSGFPATSRAHSTPTALGRRDAPSPARTACDQGNAVPCSYWCRQPRRCPMQCGSRCQGCATTRDCDGAGPVPVRWVRQAQQGTTKQPQVVHVRVTHTHTHTHTHTRARARVR